MTYITPRMLARTLKVLRDRRNNMTQRELGSKLGVAHTTISSWETRSGSIDYKILDRYQHFFGTPNGLILSISHVAALFRDSIAHGDHNVRMREKQNLLILAQCLQNLSNHILNEGIRKLSTENRIIKCNEPETWDHLISELIEIAQEGLTDEDKQAFVDHKKAVSAAPD